MKSGDSHETPQLSNLESPHQYQKQQVPKNLN